MNMLSLAHFKESEDDLKGAKLPYQKALNAYDFVGKRLGIKNSNQ